ncbi:MAG: BNR-4 repeat-containing protein [Verrucomicrobiales bacterium]
MRRPRVPLRGLWLACGVAGVMTCRAEPPPLTFLSDSIVDDKALVTPVGTTFAGAMNGTSFQNDILVSHNGWQYTAWYDTVGTDQNVWLARRSILGPDSGTWEKFDTGSDQINGDESAWDVHNTISLGISKADGILHMAWDHHVHNLRYRRSLPGLTTYADSAWNGSSILAEQNWLTSSGSVLASVTYPMFIFTPEDTLLFNYRTGGSNNGSNWLAAWQPASANYSAPILVTIKDGTYTGLSNNGGNFTSNSRNAYANGFDFGPDGKLHYTWIWRESVVASNHDVCYAYSPDRGVKWYNSSGTLIADTSLGQRIRVDTPGTVVVPLDCRQQLINQQTQCVDDQGRVHVLVRHRRQEPGFEWTLGDGAFSGPDTAYFHYFRNPVTGAWTGSRLPVTHAASSRPDVETLSNGDVYTIFRSGGRLIVAAATAAANYTDWTILTDYGSDFAGEPRLDHSRLRKSGVLSVFVSEDAPASSLPTPVPLHVIDFATAPVFEVHAGQDQRMTDEDGDGLHEVFLTASVGASTGIGVQSRRWLKNGNVLSTQAALTIELPVGSHTLVHEATSDGGLVSADSVLVTVEEGVLPPFFTVTASANDGNLPQNTLDGNLGTRWSAQGPGQFITWEFARMKLVRSVSIAFYNGDLRTASFDLLTSADGITWKPALTGLTSSGTTTALQTFDIPDTSARFIRYVGYGNSVSNWNSLTEVAFELAPSQPYMPDAHTLQLWHLDEAAPPFANAANPAHPLAGLHNGALASRPAPMGFGSSVNFNTGTGTDRGILTYASTLSASVAPETPPTFAYHGADGAFTLEALVRFDTLPGSWTSEGQIVAMEGDGTGTQDRVFQFRVEPSGGSPILKFIKVADFTQSVAAPIPMDGTHAVNTTDWFHVAVAYNGNAGAPDNTRFYWTRLAPGVERAHFVGSGTLTAEFNFSTMQGDFSIGNEARSTGGSSGAFIGSIDEVRISSIAREPDDFLFSDDTDRDSLPDTWEVLRFGNVAKGPADDYDGDGSNNRVEFLLGLNPVDGSSAFRATIQPSGANFTITWPTAPGLTFRVERSTTLLDPWTDLATLQAGTFTDTNPPPERAFYRVRLLTP